MQTIATPTGKTIGWIISSLVQTAIESGEPVKMTFNEVEIIAHPDSCESDLMVYYEQMVSNRKVAYEAQCRLEYDQLVETVRGGVPLNSDQRMWIKNVEVILGVPPESSILLHLAK